MTNEELKELELYKKSLSSKEYMAKMDKLLTQELHDQSIRTFLYFSFAKLEEKIKKENKPAWETEDWNIMLWIDREYQRSSKQWDYSIVKECFPEWNGKNFYKVKEQL